MSPSLRFGIVPGDVLDLARGRMSESIHLVHCPGELPDMVACSVAQYRDDPRETGTVSDEPLAELRGRSVTAFLVEIAEFAAETNGSEVLGFWEGGAD